MSKGGEKERLTEVISILICRGEDGVGAGVVVFAVAAAGAAIFAIVRILLDDIDNGEKVLVERNCVLDNLSVFKTTVPVDVDVVIK